MNLTQLLSPVQQLVFFGSALLMVVGTVGWVLWRGFRHEPPGLLRRSFLDATGQPNGVLLTVFNAVVMINALTITGAWTGRWPPVYVWATWGTIVLSGVVADTAVTRAQIRASKPDGFPGDDCGPGGGPGYSSTSSSCLDATQPDTAQPA